jgi:hypothetical protein
MRKRVIGFLKFLYLGRASKGFRGPALIRAGFWITFSNFFPTLISETLAGEPMDKCKMSDERDVWDVLA